MLWYFILLLPFSICFGYAMQMALRRHKTDLQKVIIALIATLGVYFLCYSYICNPMSTTESLTVVETVRQWITPFTFALAIAIINGLKRRKMFDRCFWLFMIPVFILGFAGQAFNLIIALQMLLFVLVTFQQIGGMDLSLTRFIAFFTHNRAGRPLVVIGFSFIIFALLLAERLIFEPSSFHEHLYLGVLRMIITSAVLLLMCNALYQAESPWITLRSIFDSTSVIDQNPEEEDAGDITDKKAEDFALLPSAIPAMSEAESAAILERIDKLAIAFKKYMEEDQAYLQPDITIEKVSERLGSNRFYVSRQVNVEQSMSFRDYVNSLRIDYAKQYMKQHPDATQEHLAVACGFSSASYFNRKFKQITGHSPQDWKTR